MAKSMHMSKNPDSVFPNNLLDWAGHRDGGVKKPFSTNSGRPTGALIETNLTQKLQDWANDLSGGQNNVPLAMFLVGGPGNGKTDAIETTVRFLDNAINSDGKLFRACATRFDVKLPPRKLVVDLNDMVKKSSTLHGRKLVIVQDATEVDLENAGKTPEALFLDDVESLVVAKAKKRPLFLCGVNRGILAHAVLMGHAEERNPKVLDFVDMLTRAATSGPKGQDCWPLEEYGWAVGWPMDVESLVHSRVKDKLAPARQVLERALESKACTSNCNADCLCPFHANQQLLSTDKARENFVKTLHFYELASGKRWNFRDLFSLVSHVLMGHESTFIVDGKRSSPCEWAAYHAREAQGAGPNAIMSIWSLASRLYTHALFPAWPKLDNEDIAKRTRGLEKDIDLPFNLNQFLAGIASDHSQSDTEIGQLLGEDFCQTLDPANTRRELEIRDGLTVGQVENAYTTSINRGLELTQKYLTDVELLLIKSLARADKACETSEVSPQLHAKARWVQWNLRALASRFVKRSLAGGSGICRDHAFLQRYQNLLDNTGDINRPFERLLSDGQEGLSIPLSTTFGQPLDSRWGGVRLVGEKLRIKRESMCDDGNRRPQEQLPYFSIKKDVSIPMTFPLFKALSEVDAGLMAASLPGEIFALVDGTRNLLAGRLVRDEEWLDDALVVIAESKQELVVKKRKIAEAG